MSHLAPFLDSQQSALSEQLSDLQQSNAVMMQDIERQRLEMRALLSGLEATVGNLEKSSVMVKGQEVQGLVGEVRAIDAQLRG